MSEASKNNMAVLYGNLKLTKEKRNHMVGLCNPGVNALACGGQAVRSSRTFLSHSNSVMLAGSSSAGTLCCGSVRHNQAPEIKGMLYTRKLYLFFS